MKKPFVLSWSKLQTFQQCPMKFYLMYGSKCLLGKEIIPFQENEYLKRGNELHELLENAGIGVKHNGKMPVMADPRWQEWWGEFIVAINTKYVFMDIEEKIGIDSELRGWSLDRWWRPNTSLFGNRVMKYWSKQDVMAFNKNIFNQPTKALNVDWKSGKVRLPERLGQLGLYAFLMMSMWPSLKQVVSMNVFLDQPYSEVKRQLKNWTIKYTREADFELLRDHFHNESEKIREALKANEWACTKKLCNWCPAEKEHCQYAR